MQSSTGIIIFIVCCSLLLFILITFITVIIYRYQKKQHAYYKNLNELQGKHQNILLQSQLEIQEQTFQNISREIHDNIGQKLTLAKLHLNTLDGVHKNGHIEKINNAIDMIGQAINDLSDISRSMSSEIILQNGLIKALEYEVEYLSKMGLFKINLDVSSKTVFLDARKELVLFRIVQEALNNIVKHAAADHIDIILEYRKHILILQVSDNGKGICRDKSGTPGIGVNNMVKRAESLGGTCVLENGEEKGAKLTIKLPINEPANPV